MPVGAACDGGSAMNVTGVASTSGSSNGMDGVIGSTSDRTS